MQQQEPQEQTFTVMVVPQRGARVTRMVLGSSHVYVLDRLSRLSATQLRWLAWVGGSLAVLCLGLGAGMARHYFSVVDRATENTSLREENLQLKAELVRIKESVAHIRETLGRVKQLNQTLQVISQLSDPQRKLAISPEGLEDGDPREEVDPARLGANLDQLAAEAAAQEDTLRALAGYFEDRQALLASAPSIWPTRGWITSDFGFRLDPYTAARRSHHGLDIANAPGTPVLAPASGTAVYSARENGYGNVVVLDHGSGIKTRYGHLSKIDVKVGDRVTRGQKIAEVGNTGRSTGPHLHYEVRVNGVPENPRKFILETDEPADPLRGYLSAASNGGARGAMGGSD